MRRLLAILALLVGLYGGFVVVRSLIAGNGYSGIYWTTIVLMTVLGVLLLRWGVRTLLR